MNNNDKVFAGLRIVETAKNAEKSDQYNIAANMYKEASLFFQGQSSLLYVKTSIARYINSIKFLLGEREIESVSTNHIDLFEEKIEHVIGNAQLNDIEKYKLLFTAYLELEKIYHNAYIKEKVNKFYLKRTKIRVKLNREIGRGERNIFRKFAFNCKAFFEKAFIYYCGEGEYPLRAIVISIFFIFLYASIYWGGHLIKYSNGSNKPGFFDSLYFSVVTCTTLGGDMNPACLIGQLVVIIEVITGYVMLGAMLAVINRKVFK